mmetsp:Transcript_29512/g.57768  ORF Transcript_29512/g.57768 Transcript_29512/m.57768 type:complete len:218 (+) Transcript_29512:105-758(+)
MVRRDHLTILNAVPRPVGVCSIDNLHLAVPIRRLPHDTPLGLGSQVVDREALPVAAVPHVDVGDAALLHGTVVHGPDALIRVNVTCEHDIDPPKAQHVFHTAPHHALLVLPLVRLVGVVPRRVQHGKHPGRLRAVDALELVLQPQLLLGTIPKRCVRRKVNEPRRPRRVAVKQARGHAPDPLPALAAGRGVGPAVHETCLVGLERDVVPPAALLPRL